MRELGSKKSRPQHLSAAKKDPTLPKFDIRDNEPDRSFPKEIQVHLRPPAPGEDEDDSNC